MKYNVLKPSAVAAEGFSLIKLNPVIRCFYAGAGVKGLAN